MHYATEFLSFLVPLMMVSMAHSETQTVKDMGKGKQGAVPKAMCELAKADGKTSLTAYVPVDSGTPSRMTVTFELADCEKSKSSPKVKSCELDAGDGGGRFETGVTPFKREGKMFQMACLAAYGASIAPIVGPVTIENMGDKFTANALCRARGDAASKSPVMADVDVTGSDPRITIPIIFSVACSGGKNIFGVVVSCKHWNEASKVVKKSSPDSTDTEKASVVLEHTDGKKYKMTCMTKEGAFLKTQA